MGEIDYKQRTINMLREDIKREKLFISGKQLIVIELERELRELEE